MDQVSCPRSQVLKLVPDFLREKGLEAGGWGLHGFDAPGLKGKSWFTSEEHAKMLVKSWKLMVIQGKSWNMKRTSADRWDYHMGSNLTSAKVGWIEAEIGHIPWAPQTGLGDELGELTPTSWKTPRHQGCSLDLSSSYRSFINCSNYKLYRYIQVI